MNTKFLNHSIFTFYGDGEQTRDFVYIDDLINALSIVLNTTLTDGFIYNVGTGTQTNLKAVFNRLKMVLIIIYLINLKPHVLEILNILVLTLPHSKH